MSIPVPNSLRILCCLIVSLSCEAQINVSFVPDSVVLQPGQSTFVAITVDNVPAGLAAFQLQATFDSTSLELLDPNRAFPALVTAFAPLGNNVNCATVRATTCADPVWQLSTGGRIPVFGMPGNVAANGQLTIVYGTHGAASPPVTGGAIALIEVSAVAEGNSTVSLASAILADNSATPASLPWQLVSDLSVTVTNQAVDSDGDGVVDTLDNCILVINADQFDSDSDGYGNACDTDINNDGITNFLDLAMFGAAFLTTPGAPGWNPDADINNDGVINFLDIFAIQTYFLLPPGPSGLASSPSDSAQMRDDSIHAVTSLENSSVHAILAKTFHIGRNQTVELDASASYDIEGEPLTFAWQLMSSQQLNDDANFTLSNATRPKARFVSAQAGDYVVELQVSDGVHTSTRLVRIFVHAQHVPPMALINGLEHAVSRISSPGRLAVSMQSPNLEKGQPHGSIKWQLKKADSSHVVTPNEAALEPGSRAHQVQLQMKQAGDYVLQVSHTTQTGTAQAQLRLQVEDNSAPMTLAVEAEERSATRFALAARPLDTRREIDRQLQFVWRLVTQPEQSRVSNESFSTPMLASTDFEADVPGQYLLRVDYGVGLHAKFEQILLEVVAQ